MDSCPEIQAKSHYDVVVIGGGISGVSSVYHFLLNSPQNTTKSLAILEARSRLGGRIHAMDLPSKTVELGAQWIHGIIGNPICDIAVASRLVDPLSSESSPSNEAVQGKRYTVTGMTEFGSKIPFDLIEETYQTYFVISKQADSYFSCDDETSGKLPPPSLFGNSLGKYLVTQIESYMKSKKSQLPPNSVDLNIIKGIFRNLLQREACISGSHSVFDVNLHDFGSYEELPGGNLIVECGYISIINVLLDAIDSRILELNSTINDSKIEAKPGHNNNNVKGVTFDCLLDHEVVNVKWKNVTANQCPASFSSTNVSSSPLPSNVDGSASTAAAKSQNCTCYAELTCSNGTTITANHVIVTLPLGVLKASYGTLFTPNLPEYKVKSIEALGYSVVDKVFLEFKNKLAPKFLDPSVNEFLLIWTTNPEDEDAMDCSVPVSSCLANPKSVDGRSEESCIVVKENSPAKWWRTIYSFTRISEYALLGWLSGEEAQLVESLDPVDVGRTITEEVLRRFFHPEFPEPETTFITKWAEDAYSKGSYTFVSVGSSVKDIELLSQPIYSDPCHEKPILLFAGEACHPEFYSTVHGAFLTGKKAASYLLDPEANSPR